MQQNKANSQRNRTVSRLTCTWLSQLVLCHRGKKRFFMFSLKFKNMFLLFFFLMFFVLYYKTTIMTHFSWVKIPFPGHSECFVAVLLTRPPGIPVRESATSKIPGGNSRELLSFRREFVGVYKISNFSYFLLWIMKVRWHENLCSSFYEFKSLKWLDSRY